MKKALIFLIIIIGCGWTANKYFQRYSKSSDEKDRFIEQISDFNENSKIFLTEQVKQHHEEAFAASYRMWKFSPISEIDLASHYDEQVYYSTLEKFIAEAAQKEGHTDAYTALLDIGQFYGVPAEEKTSVSKLKTAHTPSASTATKPEEKKESLLKKSTLGEKRTIPSSRRRTDDR